MYEWRKLKKEWFLPARMSIRQNPHFSQSFSLHSSRKGVVVKTTPKQARCYDVIKDEKMRTVKKGFWLVNNTLKIQKIKEIFKIFLHILTQHKTKKFKKSANKKSPKMSDFLWIPPLAERNNLIIFYSITFTLWNTQGIV